MNFEEIRQQEKENLMPTYGRFPVALVQGKGVYATDSEGKTYLDFTSGIGVNALGWCDDGWVKAVSEQAATLQHISNLYYNPVQTALAEELCRLSGFSKVFFGNSGAEANECAIKLARKFGETKAPDCKRILTLENSFHGRTVTTLAATGQDEFHHHFDPFTEGFDYAPIDDMEKVRAAVTEKTCAVMIELIQGEGGVLPLDPDFVHQVEALCRENDLLLLIDEVQTGIGRTGSLFCFQQYGIKPDVVSMAKGLGGGVPIGAVMAADTCDTVLGPGTHATTFGGTPMICAAANAVLSEVTQPEFLKSVTEKGEYLKAKILGFGSDKVKDVRGMGLMLGIVVDADARAALVKEIMDAGVLVLTAGTNAIRLLPPLSISYEEMDEALAVMQKVFCK